MEEEEVKDLVRQIGHLKPLFEEVDKGLNEVIKLADKEANATSNVLMRDTRPHSYSVLVIALIRKCFNRLDTKQRVVFLRTISHPFDPEFDKVSDLVRKFEEGDL